MKTGRQRRERGRDSSFFTRSSETLEGGAEIRGEEGEEETVLECFFLVFLERLSNGFFGNCTCELWGGMVCFVYMLL